MVESTQPTSGEPTTHAGGRPTTYTQDLADAICEELAMGTSMRTISQKKEMPAMSTMFKWLREHTEFSEQYARAKQESADAMAEDILDIADDGTNDYMEREREDGSTYDVINNEAIQRSRLRVDTRKWLMSKMKPKKYGEKLDVTSDGEKLGVAVTPEQADQLLKLRAKREPTATPNK